MAIKILMLLSTWDNEYSKAIISGISERMEDTDVTLHIFNAYDDVEEIYFDKKNREIYSLPRLEQYDGLIITFNSVASAELITDISQEFIKAGKPVVSIDQHCEGAVFCGLENYDSMYQLVEHMITIHDCRTLNYVGGPADHEENMERFRAFSDCLRDHGITLEQKRVLHKSFLRNDGKDAYNEFKALGVHMPDAVICANDYMALGYADEAFNDGVLIPDYLKVTGFDNVVAAAQYSPSITTIDRNLKQLGYDSLNALLQRIDGTGQYDTWYTRGSLCFNESCGCEVTRELRNDYNKLLMKTNRDAKVFAKQGYCRKILCSSTNIDQLQQAIYRCCGLLEIDKVSLCLNKSFFAGNLSEERVGYDDEMNMYTFSFDDKEEKELLTESIKLDEVMYPRHWENEGEKIFLYTSLHFGNQTYGYCILPYKSDFFSRNQHRTYTESMSLALENICQRITLDGMNTQLKELYVRDSLTGLYNRFGYAAKSNGFYEQNHGKVYIVYLDLDNLKTLNDDYGHACGDMAIKGVAKAMKEAFDNTDILVRMGGDEYLIMGKFTSEKEILERESRLSDILLEYGRINNSPRNLVVSAGHVFNDENSNKSLAQLVQEADETMYNVKQSRKMETR